MCFWLNSVIQMFFWGSFFTLFFTVFYANAYCKKNGINMNTFPGLLEMYRRVFRLENKRLSWVVLLTVYGGALVGIFMMFLVFYTRSQGCVVDMWIGFS